MASKIIKPVYEKGAHTLEVPMAMYAGNRQRLLARLRCLPGVTDSSIVLLQGGDPHNLYCTDVEDLFRQESYFHWCFGVIEPSFYGAIVVGTGTTLLFTPRLPAEYEVWMGPLFTLDEWRERYAVDQVHYVDQISPVLKSLKPDVLLTLNGVNSDSGLTCKEAAFDGISEFNVNNQILYNEISECRVIKSDLELEVMRYVSRVSSDAHVTVMRRARPGMYEYQCEAEFLREVYYNGGCRHVAYTCICGSGTNSSILHYGHASAPNNREIRDGDMCLFDMGASYNCYASDITCSFPANGKFTKDQAMVYNCVLRANRAVIAAMKPGMNWVNLHKLANKEMLLGLRDGGVVVGDIDAMMEANMGGWFQPHGMGHLLGCDVHDVGGYLPDCPPRPEGQGIGSLRFARDLEAGMVVTVEPGCYFIPSLLDKAINDPVACKFLVPESIERLRNFGGVRIEDNVIVTKDGSELISIVPRTVDAIEQVMAQGREEEKVILPQALVCKKPQLH